MADNVIIDSGDGQGATVHTDDLGGSPAVHVQRSKVGWGTDGNYGDVTGANPLPATITAVVTGTAATNLGKARDAILGATDTGVMSLAVRNDTLATLCDADGDYTPFQVDANGALYITGDIAHDAADSGNPMKIGAKVAAAEDTAAADNDRTDLIADNVGKLITQPYAIKQLFVSGTASVADTTETTVIAAQAAGVKTYVTTIVISNKGSTATDVDINDGTENTVMIVPAPTGSGAILNLPVPLVGTAATAWMFQANDASNPIRVSMVGYTGV